jgi:hypothetical protein
MSLRLIQGSGYPANHPVFAPRRTAPVASPADDAGQLLKPGEVARLFRVCPKTVAAWVVNGRIPASAVVMTPGGQRRFAEPAIRGLLDGRQ